MRIVLFIIFCLALETVAKIQLTTPVLLSALIASSLSAVFLPSLDI